MPNATTYSNTAIGWDRCEVTERYLTKPDRKAVVSSCETRDGAPGTLCQALDRAKENIYAPESLNRHTVSGSGETETEIPAQVASGLGPEGAK
jgi:hypothetical protein